MLEIKDIVKTYRPKNGVPVQALKSVSVKFNQKGLVFILGKSGCGKSTLLNCIGGLDKFDSGEIVIKGKSSKEFSGSDFDSYRNTFIGFIFQEYNILSEFNIEKNIALALELQGKNASKKEVQRILDMVDLGNMGKRKTNELSGGQKQRVAIARALIKDPEIIIADEPTGALDSATGIQVFDTLKKLAQDKLVIVVSHDREFAEIYGDRIIEMKDGVIISDETKRKVEPNAISDDLTMIGEDMIHIKKGHKFSEKEKDLIIKFLESRDTETIISVDEQKNQKFKQVAKIDDNNHTEKFTETTEADKDTKVYNKKELKLIKSRLKFKDAFKIGASGLKSKPVRLVFTILLSFVAFTLFGLVDTLSAYNKVTTTVNSIIDTNVNSVSFRAERRTIDKWDTINSDGEVEIMEDINYKESELRASDIAKLNEDLNLNLVGVTKGQGSMYVDNSQYYNTTQINMDLSYLIGLYSGYAYVTEEDLTALGFTVYGDLPAANETNKVAITEYIYKHFKYAGFKYGNGDNDYIKGEDLTMDNNPATGIIGKTINIENQNFIITGVVDTNFDHQRFEDLEPTDELDESSFLVTMMNRQEIEPIVKYGYHAIVFVGEQYLDKDYTVGYNLYKYQLMGETNNMSTSSSFWASRGQKQIIKYSDSSSISANVYYFDGYSASDMNSGNKVIVDLEILVNNGDILGEYYNEWWNICQGYDSPSAEFINYVKQNKSVILPADYTYSLCGENSWDVDSHTNVEIVGFTISNNYNSVPKEYIIASDGLFEDLNQPLYAYAIAPMPTDKSRITEIVEYYYNNIEGDEVAVKYVLANEITNMLSSINDTIEELSEIFLYVGLAFCLFAALMLMNFISTSISYKKREIGILRAIGARKKDVFSVFFYEALVIALINFVLAGVGTFVVASIINTALREEVGLIITFLSFGVRQVAILLAVSVLTAFLASLLPVSKIARKQPIDAINNR